MLGLGVGGNHAEPGMESGRLLLHPEFKGTLSALRDVRVALPKTPIEEELDRLGDFPAESPILERVEEEERFLLDAQKGEVLAHGSVRISAYDESVNKFQALEGTAYFT